MELVFSRLQWLLFATVILSCGRLVPTTLSSTSNLDLKNDEIREKRQCALNGKVCVGDQVFCTDTVKVTVVGIYNESEISVKYPLSDTPVRRRAEHFAITSGCNSVFCVGDLVWPTQMKLATVAGIWAGGDSQVIIDFPFGGVANYALMNNDNLAINKANCIGSENSQRPACR